MNELLRHRLRLLGLLLALAVLAAACGGGGDGGDADEESTDQADERDEDDDEDEDEEDEPTEEPTEDEEEAAEDVKDRESEDVVVIEPTDPPTTEPAATEPLPTASPGQLEGQPAQDFGDDMGVGGATTYDSYSLITDDTGAIEVEVPSEWAQVDGRPFQDAQGRDLFDVRAAPDLQGFAETWDVPGLIVTASRDLAQSANEVTLLDELVGPLSGVCTYLGRQPYDDGLYTGQADVFENCGGTETGYVVVGAVPNSRAFVIRVQVQVVDERDLEALERALASFVIVGDV